MADTRRRTLVGGASLTVGLVLWQIAATSDLIDAALISSPLQVVAVTATLAASGELARHAQVTVGELVAGFLPAVAVGVVAGVAMGRVRRLRHLLEPLAIALHGTPRIVFIPILVVWLGVGALSKVAVVFLGAVFPVLMNTLAGAQQIEPLWIQATRSLGASRLQLLCKVVLPGAAPSVMAGIRLGLGRALIGVVVGEMYVSVAGVGYLLQLYGNAGRTPELIALATLVSTTGLACVLALRWLEERMGPWRPRLDI